MAQLGAYAVSAGWGNRRTRQAPIRYMVTASIALSLTTAATAAPDFPKMAGIGWKLVEVAPRCTLESNVIGGAVAKKVRLYFLRRQTDCRSSWPSPCNSAAEGSEIGPSRRCRQ